MATTTTQATLGDRLLWTLFLGAATSAAGILAAKGAALLWTRVRREVPPRPVGVMHSLARNLGVGAVTTLLGRH